MVKYLAMALAVVGTLVIVDLAEARGRRGCSSCGGCANGACYVAPVGCPDGGCVIPGAAHEHGVPAAPAGPPAPPAASAQAPAATVAAAPASQQTQYYFTARRGMFRRR